MTVQGGLAKAAGPTCLALRQDLDPDVCRPERFNSDGTVQIRSSAALYNPVYYAVAGAPLRVVGGEVGAWAVRGLGAVLSALMIAWAWVLVASRSRTRWPSMAFLVVLTPAITFATTVAAPNGASYAAGLLLWSGLLSVRADPRTATAPAASAVGGCVVVLTHTTGIVWLGAAVLTMICLSGWAGVRHILGIQPRAWVASIGCIVVATSFAVAWILVFSPSSPTANEPLVAETKAIPMPAHVVLWIFQTIGVMPNRFGILWPVVYALWLAPLGLILVRAARAGARRERLAGSIAVTIAILVPTLATLLTYETLGVAWQGRYELPLLVGIVMMAGEALDRGAEVPRLLAGPTVILLAVTAYLCLLCLGLREADGPYDDGRPWPLLIWVAAPVLIGTGYLLLTRAIGTCSVESQ